MGDYWRKPFNATGYCENRACLKTSWGIQQRLVAQWGRAGQGGFTVCAACDRVLTRAAQHFQEVIRV